MSQDSLATRLYRGEVSYDFIGKRRYWYAMSGLVMLIGLLSLGLRGLNPSIDFKGGAEFQGPLNGHSISQIRDSVSSTGTDPQVVQQTGSGSALRFQVETKTLPEADVQNVTATLARDLGITQSQVTTTTVGSQWGSQITNKAIEGLIIFLIAVILYLSIRFEWKMALAAIIALIHDLIITAGIYSLAGLQVSPSTVIAILTILGYSLYDTVVVFDKVRENTMGITGGSRMTFTEAANLAVNQTLVRSINTSIIALLPVIGLLVIGVGVLGAGSLDDLSVALLIGLASGAYSSIFIATPLLCDFKERESTYQQLAKRVATRRTKEGRLSTLEPATAGAPLAATTGLPGRPSANPSLSSDSVSSDSAPFAGDDDPASRPSGPPPRPGARPGNVPPRRRSSKGGRPGGRNRKSRKRR